MEHTIPLYPELASETTGRFREFDERCKTYLSTRLYLAHLLHFCVKEFQSKSIRWIYTNAFCGEPVTVQTEEGQAPGTHRRIHGANTEDIVLGEGERHFDLLFPAQYDLSSEDAVVWVNVEAQKSANVGYSLLTRAHYYVSRMTSREYRRDFIRSEYDKIRKVYSIWIVLNPRKDKQNNWFQYRWTGGEDGNSFEESFDPSNIQIISLGKDAQNSDIPIVQLMALLIGQVDSWEKRITLLKENYNIELDLETEKELKDMCNLGEGWYEMGVEEGLEKGLARGEENGLKKGLLQGEESGRVKELTKNLRTLMKNLNCNLETAFQYLDIPKEKQEEYQLLIEQNA